MLDSELWEDDFSSLLSRVKDFIVDMCESRKLRLCGDNVCPGPSPTPQPRILVRMVYAFNLNVATCMDRFIEYC